MYLNAENIILLHAYHAKASLYITIHSIKLVKLSEQRHTVSPCVGHSDPVLALQKSVSVLRQLSARAVVKILCRF
jgi:hypothetical protein